jgi:predicted hydrolase (HD superfamily)
MTTILISGVEYIIAKHKVPRGVAQRLRRHAEQFFRMGFEPNEIRVLARHGVDVTEAFEIVPDSIVTEKGRSDAPT